MSEDGVLPPDKLFSPHRICKKHVRGWGISTRQAFFAPSVSKKLLKGWAPATQTTPTNSLAPSVSKKLLKGWATAT